MCQCEDRPCCGHAAEERANDAYWAERAYYGDQYDDYYFGSRYDESDEDEWDDESDDNPASWMAEDAALESSLFGDC
jgi:hypothetical protein